MPNFGQKELLVTCCKETVKMLERLPVSAALVRGFIQHEDTFIYFLTVDPEVGNLTSDDKR